MLNFLKIKKTKSQEVYEWSENFKFSEEECFEIQDFLKKDAGQKLIKAMANEVLQKSAIAIRQVESEKSHYLCGIAFGYDCCFSLLKSFLKFSPKAENTVPADFGARLRH